MKRKPIFEFPTLRPLAAILTLSVLVSTALGDGKNQPPVCVAGPEPVITCQGDYTMVLLDGSASYDPEGEPLTYQWGACPGTFLTDPTSPVTLAYIDTSADCSLVCGIRLRVSDPAGLYTACRTYVRVVEPACEFATSICSNFNGTAIPAGRTIWFNSVAKLTGPIQHPAEIYVTNARIQFSASGTNYDLALPDSIVRLSASASTATTTYDDVAQRWVTTIPLGLDKQAFFSGVAFPVTQSLPGGINPVCFSADVRTDTPGLGVKWKWAAAVYTQFPSDPGQIGVKPIDGSTSNPYANSDHAGTPENFKAFVVGGARGGGGSNFTGSYSGTISAACP